MRQTRSHSIAQLAFWVFGSMVAEAEALAGTKTWSGSAVSDSDWTSNLNWEGLGGAGVDDDLVFPAGANRLANHNDFATNTNFNSISFTGPGYSVTGNQIFLTAGLSSNVSSGTGAIFNPGIVVAANSTFTASNTRSYTLNGTVNLNAKTLTLQGPGTHIFNGTITSTTGIGNFVKDGNGIAFIEGTATVLGGGALKAAGGDLRINGTGGTVHMIGGTLSGTGTVQSVISFGNGGIIAPGDGGPGVLNATGAVGMGPSVTFSVDLNGTTVNTQYDRLSVTGGNVSLSNTDLSIALGFTPTTGTQFTIIQCTGCLVTGEFSQGNRISANGKTFSITYNPSSVVLTVLAPPDITVTKTHTGNFTQGQVGATYSITVSNVGGVASSGTITVTDTLPTGLSATGIAGTGWNNCTQPGGPCTRSTILDPGASYPELTLTVNVAADAPAMLTNSVSVSGGGDANAANNSSDDITTIVAGSGNQLSVTRSGHGAGTVNSVDAFINCGATCSAAYASGAMVTLNATPMAGSMFTGWLGACTGTGACLLTMSAARTVSATFALNSIGTDWLDIDGDGTYDALTDGLMVARYLLGLSGAAVTAGATAEGAPRSATTINDYLVDVRPKLDIDGNGQVDPLTDGVLIIRYLFGVRGATLIQNTGGGGIRTLAPDIETYLLSLVP